MGAFVFLAQNAARDQAITSAFWAAEWQEGGRFLAGLA